MQAVHELLDGRGPVPPMDVEDVDVRRAELLQASLDTEFHGLGAVAQQVRLLLDVRLPQRPSTCVLVTPN